MSMRMRSKVRKGKRLGLVRGQKGFTLVEILVAIAIMGVVAVGFLSALTTAYGSVIVADRHTKAENLTRTTFEYMRNLPYSANFNSPAVTFPAAWHPDANYGYPYYPRTDYKVHVTSTLSVDNSTSPVKELVVAVLYGDTPVHTTTTYRSDPNRNLL